MNCKCLTEMFYVSLDLVSPHGCAFQPSQVINDTNDVLLHRLPLCSSSTERLPRDMCANVMFLTRALIHDTVSLTPNPLRCQGQSPPHPPPWRTHLGTHFLLTHLWSDLDPSSFCSLSIRSGRGGVFVSSVDCCRTVKIFTDRWIHTHTCMFCT